MLEKMIDFWDIVPNTYRINENGEVKNIKTGNILKWNKTHRGYYKVTLKTKSGYKYMFVHRLVAKAYIPTDNDRLEINHIDGDKYNNHINNLEWCDRRRNVQHAFDNGLNIGKKGVENANSIYSEEMVHKICKMIEQGFTNSEIEKRLNMKKRIGGNFVSSIRNGKSWSHISQQYDISNKIKYKGLQSSRVATIEQIENICRLMKHKPLSDKEIAVCIFGCDYKKNEIHLIRDIKYRRRYKCVSEKIWSEV